MCHAHLDDLHLLLFRFDWFLGQSWPVTGRLHKCECTSDWLQRLESRGVNSVALAWVDVCDTFPNIIRKCEHV